MTKVKDVEFCFENVEVMSVSNEHVDHLSVGDFDYRFYKHHDSIIKIRTANNFSMSIFKSGDIEHDPFEHEEWRTTTFNRLQKHSDIVSIRINFDDDTSEEFYVKWDGESDYTNAFQHYYTNDFGDLYMVIGPEKSIVETFDLKYINDENSRYFRIKFNE